MEDSAIVALYWARSEQAIVETDQKYGPYCRTIAQNILTLPEDAEECVNDTWHHAWNTMPPQQPDRLPPFLGRIVRNLSVSRWRHTHAQKRYSALDVLLSELEECVPAPSGVEEVVEGRELTGRVETWLERLSKDERVLFLRRYWYGEEVKTLAKARGVGVNQLSKQLQRLRRALKTDLEQEGYIL